MDDLDGEPLDRDGKVSPDGATERVAVRHPPDPAAMIPGPSAQSGPRGWRPLAAAGLVLAAIAAVALANGWPSHRPAAAATPASTPEPLPSGEIGTRIWLMTQDRPGVQCPLVKAEGYLGANPSSGLGLVYRDSMLAVSWPQRYFAALVDSRIGLFDSTGAFVAREGDYLTMGGGGPNPFAVCPPNSIELGVPGSDAPPTPPPGSLTESQALGVAFRALDMRAEQPVRVSGAIESSFGTVAPGSGGDNANAIVWAFTFPGPFDVPTEGPWSGCGSGGTNGCPSSALIAVDVTSGNVVVNSYTSLSPGASVAPLPTNPWWLGNEPTTCGFPAVYRIEAEPGIVGLGGCDSTFGPTPRSINLLAGERIDLHMTQQQFLGPPVLPVPVTSDDSVVRLVTEGQTDATFEAVRPGTAELLTTGGCPSTTPWSCALAIVNVFGTGASPPPSVPPIAPCPSEPLRLQGSLTGGGTGTAQLDLKITNFAAVECPFFGAPADVSLLRADGTTLAITTRTTTDGSPVAGIVLDPGGSAEVAYNWSNWCAPDPRPLSVRLTLASGTTLVGPVSGPSGVAFIPRCDAPQGSSHLVFLWGFEAATTP